MFVSDFKDINDELKHAPGVNISQNSWINHPGKVSLFGLVREEFHISIIHAFCRELHFEQKTCLKQKLSALFKCFLT